VPLTEMCVVAVRAARGLALAARARGAANCGGLGPRLWVKRGQVLATARVGADISPVRVQNGTWNWVPGVTVGHRRRNAPFLTHDHRCIPYGGIARGMGVNGLGCQAGLSVPAARVSVMADSRLSVRDRELFLAEPHIAALSVSAGPDRGPWTVPMWYQYEPGGEAWVLTEAASPKTRLIEAAGRFTLMVERVAPTVRYVSVEGPVSRMVPETDELLREITERYLPPDKVPAYLEFAKAELGEQVAIYLRPQRWLTADLGPS
jgi:Pyridoxamine 5'-phosphate oxidase